MDLLFLGMTASLIGKILLGIAVINVHGHIAKEHKIDIEVVTAMRREQYFVLVGLLLIVAGYILEIIHFGYLGLV